MPKYPFNPDYASPPGDTLRETMEHAGVTESQLECVGVNVSQILNGAPITEVVASILEEVFGIPAQFWMNREKMYREQIAKMEKRKEQTEDDDE